MESIVVTNGLVSYREPLNDLIVSNPLIFFLSNFILRASNDGKTNNTVQNTFHLFFKYVIFRMYLPSFREI